MWLVYNMNNIHGYGKNKIIKKPLINCLDSNAKCKLEIVQVNLQNHYNNNNNRLHTIKNINKESITK